MAKARKTQAPPADRRTRREAQRTERRTERRSGPAARGGFSPLVLVTAAAIVLGLAIVAFVALQGRPAVTIVAPPTAVAVPTDLAHDRAIGSVAAPVTLDVWSDFQCPSCLAYWTLVNPQVITNDIAPGKVRLIYRDFVFIGQESTDAAVAARCANRQGSADFWLYHDYLYANQGAENSGAFSRDRLVAMATMAGLDVASFSACLDDPSVAQAVTAETAQGSALGVHQTPTLMIGSQQLPGFDYPAVVKALDAALGTSGSPSPSASGSPSPSTGGSPSS
ncbi:MAG: DsbA family protein [Candidatus Limnocylindrales bacterium]